MSNSTPHVSHLPLKIIHNFPYPASASVAEKKEIVTKYLLYIMDRGFGGVVSNVCTRNYTQDPQEWEVFAHLADECQRLGLRLWIYDEDGYPSGAAGGLTIAENPEFEAVGIAMLSQPIGAEESITIELPKGHAHFLFAGVYLCDENQRPTPANNGHYPAVMSADCKYSTAPVTLYNPLPYPCMAYVFVQKPLYEGTHCVHNVFQCRRYIDVTNPQAVAAFLRNTYDLYAQHVPDHLHAGAGRVHPQIGQIEAIFTDEPSFMGCYINQGLYPNDIKDPFDDEVPLYPVLSYGRNVENAFASRYGYELLPRLVAIFTGESDYAMQVRSDYYALMSDLYETAFFAQISDWCAKHEISFSGHLLLEDQIKYHTIFEGNYFSLLRHMHFPGIDMLFSIPSQVREMAFTPKLVSSIAHAYNRPHVMSEVSAHAHGGNVTHDEMYASLCAQYAMGVDIFTYYYSEQFMDPPTYTRYNHALGRIDDAMQGQHVADVLLYYPIEVFRRHHKPSDAQYGTYTEIEEACQAQLVSIIDTLLDNQLDFDFVDAEALSHMSVDGFGRYISSSHNEAYRLLIIPPMDKPLDVSTILGEKASLVAVLQLSAEDVAGDDLINKIKSAMSSQTPMPLAVTSTSPCKGLLTLARHKGSYAKRSYLFVNTNPYPVETTLTVSCMTSPILYDPMNDTICPCDFTQNNDGHTFKLILQAHESLIVKEMQS